MEKEFIKYTEAIALKELGFDEPCLGYHAGDILCTGQPQEIHLDKDGNYKKTKTDSYPIIAAPTYSQAFRWFREKYDLNSLVVFDKYICEIDDKELENPYFTYYYSINELWSEGKDYGKFTRGFINVASNRDMLSYEEAELECIKKLIEIVKQK